VTKRCRDCEQDKPLDEFWRNKSSPDGLATYCIPCFKRRNRAASERRAAREGRVMRDPSNRPVDVSDGHRYCPSCQQVLPIEDFVRNRRTKSGWGSYCRPCQRAKVAESVKRRHGTTRHYHLKRRYGIGADDVLAMLETQGSACLICRRQLSVATAHVDHDHATGKVRGILCFACNGGMGQFGDDPEVLMRAARYLLAATRSPVPVEVLWTDRLTRAHYGTAS
jgi:peptide methionine sulfoxide reductase MsrB